MSKDDTIKNLEKLRDACMEMCHWDSVEALDEAIKTLRALPDNLDLQSTCNQLATDCISRESAIDSLGEAPMVRNNYEFAQYNQWKSDKQAIETVPSAQPETHEKRTETHSCDLIDRQAAIDALSTPHGILYPIRTVEELPSAQPEPHWIPVSERLPEANGRYLVTRGLNACGAMWNRVYIINYSDLMGLKSERIWWDGNVGKSDFERIDDVIAWMTLPEPWKGEMQDE